MIAPLAVASFVDSVIRLLRIVFNKDKKQIYDFIYSAGAAAYLGLGIFDEQGFINGWGLVAFRLVFAAVFLAVYSALQSQFQKSQSVLDVTEFSKKQGVFIHRYSSMHQKFLTLHVLKKNDLEHYNHSST